MTNPRHQSSSIINQLQLWRAPLRRALQKFVEDPLSEALIEGRLTGSSLIEIYKADKGTLAIRPLTEEGLADLETLADGGGRNNKSFKAE